MFRHVSIFAFASALMAAMPLAAQNDRSLRVETSDVTQLAPRQPTLDTRLDYTWWDTRLKKLVISMGPSSRTRPGRPQLTTGSSILWGHTSPYRLEGTRMAFSLIVPEVARSFSEYRRDLQDIAARIDLPSLSRNEQLAFWINLHNVAVAEQIALNWPIQKPDRILIDGEPLHDARFLEIRGIRLSLTDIRTRIVYPNWRDPRVIYGFWHGRIGGPSLQRAAYTGENLSSLLDRGGREFVNSLRGTQRRGDTLLVSEIYEEAAPFYFRRFEPDLRLHLATFAQEEVAAILDATQTVQASISAPDIADLAGGMRETSASPVTINGRPSNSRITPSIARLLAERNTKLMEMGRERRGTVTVQHSDASGNQPTQGIR